MRTSIFRIGCAICFALLANAAGAECGPTPGGPPSACTADAPASIGANGGADAGVGNPINVMTGNKYQREEDMPALPGVLGLEIVRHYNSAYSKPGAPNGPMGREWKLSYETELFDKFGRIQILQADGARVTFNRDPNNPDLCSTALPANGRVALRRQPDGTTDYTWTWPDGRRLHFNRWGKLDSITAATGEAVALQYDPDQLLVRVTDPQGRSLRLGYLDRASARAGNRFRGVQSIDSPVGRFVYDYGGAAPQGATPFDARILWANMARVRLPGTDEAPRRGAVSRLYHHEDSRFPWLLTGISIATTGADGKPVARRFATFGYDDNGRANLSTHAGGVDKVTLDIADGGKTMLTNSLGQRTVYRHAIVGGEHRLLEVRGAGCATCGETNVRYGYDRLGRHTEATKLNADGELVNAVRSELDKLGRVVRVGKIAYRNGKPGPAQWRVRFEYAGDGAAPTLIARPSVVPGRERQTRIAYNLAGQPLSVTDLGWIPTYDGRQAAAQMTRTTSYQYTTINGRSLLTRIDGPLPNGPANSPRDSDVTVFEYDHLPDNDAVKRPAAKPGTLARYDDQSHRDGALTAILAPGNFKSTLTYDAAGRIISIIDAAGRSTRLSYTPRGQIRSETRDGVTRATTFDGMDHPVEIRDGDITGRQALTRLGYDDAGRLIWSASHLGIFSSRRYDTESHVLETATQSNAIRQARTYAYDLLGRPVGVTDAGGGSWSLAWNARNLPEQASDALGRITRYRYDEAENLVGVKQAANTPEALLYDTETRFEPDVNGQARTVITPGGATTRYLRDDFGQIVFIISPDSGVSSQQFDSAGRLVSSSDAIGNKAAYEYDAAGRIIRQTILDKGVVPGREQTVTSWRYAGKRLAAIDHPEQAERYSYDMNGRVGVKTVLITLANGKQVSYRTSYRYDGLGQLAAISLPDGSMLNYRRNGQNQVVELDRTIVHGAWLDWLPERQTIVKHLERDIVGLKRLTYGNGVEAIYQRSKEGALARILYRTPAELGRGATLASMLGISEATAAPSISPSTATTAALPGALALPPEPAALLDHRYLWDVQGNLLHIKDKDSASGYAYDAFDRLIAAGTKSSSPRDAATFDRYHFDAGGNRLLTQEGIASQSDTRGNTSRASYAANSNRWQGATSGSERVAINYDAAGQPKHIGERGYTWNALGKLMEVRQGQDRLAAYRYNHRGQRIAKEVRGVHTYYLYDDDRNLLAELDGDGKISRQYIYLAGRPVAIIDTAPDGAGYEEKRTQLAQAMADMATIWQTWRGRSETIAFLMTNHLGATELIVDAQGKLVWEGAYAPFGKVRERRARGRSGFQFNQRLPGQYEDRETGLYYNDHRYYDPTQGRYLTPDPLGLRAGGNGYSYAGGNPLKYIDPNGLLLFAFDGTNNSKNPPSTDSISNVLKFYEAYDQIQNGGKYYITGIGTADENMPYAGNAITGDGFDQRVELGFTSLEKFIKTDAATDTINIDVVGFSRGAAEARVWINALVAKLKNGAYTVDDKSRCINLRFEGLWDTVPHLGLMHGNESKYDFSIPAAVKYAVQAVALNEHRGSAADFSLRSIMATPAQTSSSSRIEKGFIGSHSDLGGGYGTGDLSDVALMWMIDQARGQGIEMTQEQIDDNGWGIVTNPIVHDSSGNRFASGIVDDTRTIVYGNGSTVSQTSMIIDGKKTADTTPAINYFSNPYRCGTKWNPDVGLVDMAKYNLWLAGYGMTMPTGEIVNNSCKP